MQLKKLGLLKLQLKNKVLYDIFLDSGRFEAIILQLNLRLGLGSSQVSERGDIAIVIIAFNEVTSIFFKLGGHLHFLFLILL